MDPSAPTHSPIRRYPAPKNDREGKGEPSDGRARVTDGRVRRRTVSVLRSDGGGRGQVTSRGGRKSWACVCRGVRCGGRRVGGGWVGGGVAYASVAHGVSRWWWAAGRGRIFQPLRRAARASGTDGRGTGARRRRPPRHCAISSCPSDTASKDKQRSSPRSPVSRPLPRIAEARGPERCDAGGKRSIRRAHDTPSASGPARHCAGIPPGSPAGANAQARVPRFGFPSTGRGFLEFGEPHVALPVHGSLARGTAGAVRPHGSRLWIDPSLLRPAADCEGGPTHAQQRGLNGGRRLDGGGSPSVWEEGTPAGPAVWRRWPRRRRQRRHRPAAVLGKRRVNQVRQGARLTKPYRVTAGRHRSIPIVPS
uniref:Uncharacterized protein n=1 Tax=Setaria viridis TaxID=4556 RepID=A0A4U6TTA1_SETVI|nr:hypothetical protein SEVIR_7G230401v2 [Setaria viridis]